MKRFVTALCAASALTMGAAAAHAATLTVMSIGGEWMNPVGGTAVNNSMDDDTAKLRWGTPLSGQSGYDFTPTATPIDPAEDSDFALGTFTHHNFPIDSGTAISSATLRVTFTFYLGTDIANPLTRSSDFVFGHWETPNADAPCADGGTNGVGVNINGCADRVVATTNPTSTESFTIVDGDTTHTYVFAVSGFNIGDAFWTVEQQTNNATLMARYTHEANIMPAPIPLPAAAWLLLAGVGCMAYAGRRRKA